MKFARLELNGKPFICFKYLNNWVSIVDLFNELGGSFLEIPIEDDLFLTSESFEKIEKKIQLIELKTWSPEDLLRVSISPEKFLPPVKNPPLVFGLAGNCPKTWRVNKTTIQNYPVGYTRTPHTLSGHQESVYIPKEVRSFRCATELGVIISKDARKVSADQAMEYVAGYTIVNDMISNHWKDFAQENNPQKSPAFLELLVTSYYGRGTRGFAPIGPYMVTKDMIPDPYNLLVHTRINHKDIDRSHTGAMVVGIEQAIEYLSQFMTLKAGSVIHMGTMGLDGVTLDAEVKLRSTDFVEMEIENLGILKTYFNDGRLL